jgi:DNA-binding response OmpR family regulator
MSMNENHRGTIVIVHDSPAVLELLEQALRDRSDVVFATRDASEALDVVKRVQVDLLILQDPGLDVEQRLARDARTIQPSLRVIYLGREPVSLSRLRQAISAELAR